MASSIRRCDDDGPPSYFIYSVRSGRCQGAMLAGLVVLAAVTGVADAEKNTMDSTKQWIWNMIYQSCSIVQYALVLYVALVIALRRVTEIRLFLFTTIFLVSITLFSYAAVRTNYLYVKDICMTILCAAALPYLAMCCKQPGWIHRLCSVFIVFLTLILANIPQMSMISFRMMSEYDKWAVLTPVLTIIVYNATVIGQTRKIKWMSNKAYVKMLLRCSGALIIVGSSIAAVAFVFEEIRELLAVVGFTLAMAGCLAFNSSLVIQREKRRMLNVNESAVIKNLVIVIGLSVIVFLICLDLLGVFHCIAHYKMAVVIPVYALVCLYFSLIYLHKAIREKTPTGAFLLLIFGCMLVTGYITHFAAGYNLSEKDREPEARFRNPTPTVPPLTPEEKRAKNQTDTARFAMLECCMVLVYLLMTVLQKADDEALENNADARLSYRPIPIHSTNHLSQEAPIQMSCAASFRYRLSRLFKKTDERIVESAVQQSPNQLRLYCMSQQHWKEEELEDIRGFINKLDNTSSTNVKLPTVEVAAVLAHLNSLEKEVP